jgi:antitoxin HicB
MTTKDYLREPYTRALRPDEKGGFYAEVLEFPGCFAEGETPNQTYKELEDAAESWIEARLAQGQDVPVPFNNLGYSGMISLRLPRTIHKRAAAMAELDRVSLNSFLTTAIATRVGAEEFYTTLTNRFENRIMETAYSYLNYIQEDQTIGNRTLPLRVTPNETAHTSSAHHVRLTRRG